MRRRALALGIALGTAAAGVLAGWLAFAPAATQAAAGLPVTAAVSADNCPVHPRPLTSESVARAADQARIQAPHLFTGFGPAVVELAWQAKFRLNVWAASPFTCSNLVRQRTVVVDLFFPKMLPSASLSKGVVFVSLFNTGYRVWKVAH